MSFQVYALREIGSLEVRYVGQTRHSWKHRLAFLSCLARRNNGEVPMREWLRGCDFQTEGVVLLVCDTREEAKASERLAIQMFHAAGHRLLNTQHVPKRSLLTEAA